MEKNRSEENKFFSKISHDLRGSFTSILGFSDILTDPDENLTREEIDEFVNRISAQTRDSFDLLVNFINWLKLDSFDYGLESEEILLKEIVLNIESNLKKITAKKNLEFENRLESKILVNADYEIIMSILNNVIKYSVEIAKNDERIIIKDSIDDENKILEISILQLNDKVDYLNQESEFQSIAPQTILFAKKLLEILKGKIDFLKNENSLKIKLTLP